MKTIAITIDEAMLRTLDKLAGARAGNRSEVVRAALGEYLGRLEKARREAEERKVWEKHYDRLNRQARAQLADQAES